MTELTLTQFIKYLEQQSGMIERPVRSYVEWWGRCKGYRVSSARFQADRVTITQRNAWATEHSVDEGLLEVQKRLGVKGEWEVEEALGVALEVLMESTPKSVEEQLVGVV